MNADLAWAIVQLAEPFRANGGHSPEPVARADVPAELAFLPGRRALIVVQEELFRHLPGVSTIPLADGRAFLAFDGSAGIAGLEVAILDRIDSLAARSPEREALTQLRELVRGWRRDETLRFTTKSIILVEGARDRPVRQLPRLTRER